jgi:hypothetical protein
MPDAARLAAQEARAGRDQDTAFAMFHPQSYHNQEE